jgi:hypothetical protein
LLHRGRWILIGDEVRMRGWGGYGVGAYIHDGELGYGGCTGEVIVWVLCKVLSIRNGDRRGW